MKQDILFRVTRMILGLALLVSLQTRGEEVAVEAAVVEAAPVVTNGSAPDVLTMRDLPEIERHEDLISISLDNVDLQDVVRMFTRISEANFIAAPSNLQGKVTVNLNDVEWLPAMKNILSSHNLALNERVPGTGIYTIEPVKPDAPEPLEVETLFLSYATVKEVQGAIQPVLIPNAKLSPFPSRNAMVIKTTAANMQEVRDIIAKIDKMRKQVFIEAKFLELEDQAIKDLGINWQSLEGVGVTASGMQFSHNWNRNRQSLGNESLALYDASARGRTAAYGYDRFGQGVPYDRDNDGYPDTEGQTTYLDVNNDGDYDDPGEQIVSSESISFPAYDPLNFSDSLSLDGYNSLSLNTWGRSSTYNDLQQQLYEETIQDAHAAILGIDDFRVVLSALKQTAGVTIVSNPKIIVANEEAATIHIGEKLRPFISTITPPTESTGPVVSYNPGDEVDTGVKVVVTPTVNTSNNITVVIEPEITRITSFDTAPTGQTYPIIAKKTVKTQFCLESGKTVAIGGLTETDNRNRVSKIPLLGDIPFLGKYLFSHTHKQKYQRETIIFVTVGLADPEAIETEQGLPENTRLTQKHMVQTEHDRVEFNRSMEKIRQAVTAAEADPENEELMKEVNRAFRGD